MQRVHIEGLTRRGWSEAPTSPSSSQQPCQILRAGSSCSSSKAPVGAARCCSGTRLLLILSERALHASFPPPAAQAPRDRPAAPKSKHLDALRFSAVDFQSAALFNVNVLETERRLAPPWRPPRLLARRSSCLQYRLLSLSERCVLSLLHVLAVRNRPGCLSDIIA